jgi:hypothetical protein
MTTQSVLRRHGVRVPDYLFETLTLGERLAFLRGRVGGPAPAQPEPAAGQRAHGRPGAGRARQLPGRLTRAAQLAAAWRRARTEARSLGGRGGR